MCVRERCAADCNHRVALGPGSLSEGHRQSMTSQMFSQSNSSRTTTTGRSYADHFHDQDLYRSSEIDPPEGAEYALLQVSRTAAQYGFLTLFHATLALAEQHDEQSQRELVCFTEDSGLVEFIGLACRKDVKGAIESPESRAQLNEALYKMFRKSIALSGRNG
jgi:hypothetical protein